MIKAIKEELQKELDWYQQAQAEAGQKLHELKGHKYSDQRGDWGRYKQNLDIHQRVLESWSYSLESLEKRCKDVLEVAQDIELGELVLEELEQIRNEAEELRLAISELERPQTPPEREEEHDSAQSIPSLEELQDVTARNAIIARGGGGSLRIILRPIAETDEVEIIKEPYTSAPDKNETPEWSRQFLGQMLQTVWFCKNLQNYQDMVIFAFEFLHPTLAFVAEYSVLRVFSFDQMAQ